MINLLDIKDKLYNEDIILYSLIRHNDYPVRVAITQAGNLTISAGGNGTVRESTAYFLTEAEALQVANIYNAQPNKIKLKVDKIPKAHLTRIFNKAKEEALVPILEEFTTNYGKCYKLVYKKDKAQKENLELYIFRTIDNQNKLKIEDYSSKNNVSLKFITYFTNIVLFEIQQYQDDLQFLINLKRDGEEFKYSCVIKNKADYLKALDRTIEALESYPQFDIYKNQLQDIRDIYD